MLSDSAIRSLAHELHQIKMSKEIIGWHLETLEYLALEVESEEESEEETSEEETSGEEEDKNEDDDDNEEANKTTE